MSIAVMVSIVTKREARSSIVRAILALDITEFRRTLQKKRILRYCLAVFRELLIEFSHILLSLCVAIKMGRE
jgi:hypothetical protein